MGVGWTAALRILSQVEESKGKEHGIIKVLRKWENSDVHIIRREGAIAEVSRMQGDY